MRFLIDADLPRCVGLLLAKHGHEAMDARDIGPRHAQDPIIARYAQEHGACLLTGDFGFADLRNYPPETYPGIAVLDLPRDANALLILGLIGGLVRQAAILERLPGRLAIVAAGRIRLRPA